MVVVVKGSWGGVGGDGVGEVVLVSRWLWRVGGLCEGVMVRGQGWWRRAGEKGVVGVTRGGGG